MYQSILINLGINYISIMIDNVDNRVVAVLFYH